MVFAYVFAGVSAVEMWRGDLKAERVFCRLFVLYVLVDTILLMDIAIDLFLHSAVYAFALLPVLVWLPFYQRRLALTILRESDIRPEKNIKITM